MNNQNLDHLLSQAVSAVLETMFFSTSLGPAEPETSETALEARLAFHGCVSGDFGVRLSDASARYLAAAFLGEDEEMLTNIQTGQVVCEFANMLCGWFVSNLEGEEYFGLDTPELITTENESLSNSAIAPPSKKSFALERGILTVTLRVCVPA